ncbi:type IV pilin N-terminal domain-containing protein [Halosimplex aquaticum]|uniref:Type IV pilin N-terminal domain-containing protein n=1 Tax=Halosimplex aquaticum TaxID=3026162 RepID=A0ABD5Y9M2_9EURY
MVAITVLLAATVATFFMGYEDSLTGMGAPTVAISGEFGVGSGGHELALEFTGGEVVPRENVKVQVSNANCLGHGTVTDRFDLRQLGVSASEVMAGTEAEVSVDTVCPSAAGRLKLSGTEVTVTWISSDGADGNVLYRWRGPGA